jgi:hypothetical protein
VRGFRFARRTVIAKASASDIWYRQYWCREFVASGVRAGGSMKEDADPKVGMEPADDVDFAALEESGDRLGRPLPIPL